MTISWAYFPRNERASDLSRAIVQCFEQVQVQISSQANDQLISADYKDAASNQVLQKVRPGLIALDFKVEASKATADKIRVPVLFGMKGEAAMSFEADAYNEKHRYVVEIEAGRAVTNYQFLKDLFQACVMVDVDFLCIAVRNVYRESQDFKKVYNFLDTLYTSGRLKPAERHPGHWILTATALNRACRDASSTVPHLRGRFSGCGARRRRPAAQVSRRSGR